MGEWYKEEVEAMIQKLEKKHTKMAEALDEHITKKNDEMREMEQEISMLRALAEKTPARQPELELSR